MKTIELVSHCYCPPNYDGYAQMLKYQMSSLIKYAPNDRLIYTIFYVIADEKTKEVLVELCPYLHDKGIKTNTNLLTEETMFRRGFGRNRAALTSKADVVWFIDCDYMFGPRCLEETMSQVVKDDVLYYPERHYICQTHRAGDAALKQAEKEFLIDNPLNRSAYIVEGFTRSIGGVQIVTGDTARSRGYLKDSKWSESVTAEGGFRNTTEDVAYRKSFAKTSQIPIPHIYRLRHSVTGLEAARPRTIVE